MPYQILEVQTPHLPVVQPIELGLYANHYYRCRRWQLLTLIKGLITAQLVVEESAEQFAFRHALTRQTIYADLLVCERKVLHPTIADTMERLYISSLDGYLADLAYHFYATGAWGESVGE